MHPCDSTGLFKMIVGVLTTFHTQYTWDTSICIFFLFNRTTLQVFATYLTGALYVHHLWFYRVILNDCRGWLAFIFWDIFRPVFNKNICIYCKVNTLIGVIMMFLSWHLFTMSIYLCCFGGLGVAFCPLLPKFVVGFLGRKNPQHAFLRRGSKAVGPMS